MARQDRRRAWTPHRRQCGSDFSPDPNQLYGYDPKTGKLYALEDQVGTYNLATIIGRR